MFKYVYKCPGYDAMIAKAIIFLQHTLTAKWTLAYLFKIYSVTLSSVNYLMHYLFTETGHY